MAYITQDQKKEIATLLKNVVPRGWKYSLAINNHSALVMTIRSAPVDLLSEWFRCSYKSNYVISPVKPKDARINEYNLERQFNESLETIKAIEAVLNTGNYDNSDIQADYFNVGFYVTLQLGTWDKPFKFLGE